MRGMHQAERIDIGMFPGQGSQHVGMGEELFARYPQVCARANEILGYSLTDICLADGEQLKQTRYTQPAIYLVSCLDHLAWTEDKARSFPSAYIGHSAGLYAALYASGILDLYDGLRVIAKRGELMQKMKGGAMMAVISSDTSGIEKDLARLGLFDVEVANFNSREQVVIAGLAEAISQATKPLQELGYRCVPLPVGGAFHSRHMAPCRKEFMACLLDLEFRAPQVTVISTTTGEEIDRRRLLEEMAYQLVRPVRWWQTIHHLVAGSGGKRFYEFGPGTILTNLTESILHEFDGTQSHTRKGLE